MRKRLHKAWQNFLYISVIVAIVSSIICICYLDVESWIPEVVIGINASWLMLIFIANDEYRIEEKKRREHKHGTKGKSYRNDKLQRRSA